MIMDKFYSMGRENTIGSFYEKRPRFSEIHVHLFDKGLFFQGEGGYNKLKEERNEERQKAQSYRVTLYGLTARCGDSFCR